VTLLSIIVSLGRHLKRVLIFSSLSLQFPDSVQDARKFRDQHRPVPRQGNLFRNVPLPSAQPVRSLHTVCS
jgi:hypothetical protein